MISTTMSAFLIVTAAIVAFFVGRALGCHESIERIGEVFNEILTVKMQEAGEDGQVELQDADDR